MDSFHKNHVAFGIFSFSTTPNLPILLLLLPDKAATLGGLFSAICLSLVSANFSASLTRLSVVV